MATSKDFLWPPVGNSVAVYGEILMAADSGETPYRWSHARGGRHRVPARIGLSRVG